MGVMSCSRKGCKEIMCQTHINEVGYICYDCEKEFKEKCENSDVPINTEREIMGQLKKFMETEKNNYDDTVTDVNSFFDKHRS